MIGRKIITQQDPRNTDTFNLFSKLMLDTNITLYPTIPYVVSFNDNGNPNIKTIKPISSISGGFKYQIYIPFTQKNVMVSEWKNGIYELYPTYTVVCVVWNKISPEITIDHAFLASTKLIEKEYITTDPKIKNGNVKSEIVHLYTLDTTFDPNNIIKGAINDALHDIISVSEALIDNQNTAFADNRLYNFSNRK